MLLKCKMCGGDLQPTKGMNIVECEFCGTMQTIANLDNEKKTNLFNRANHLRMSSEFDKAAAVYEGIIAEFPQEAEAYWGLSLCAYGIEYVDDPITGRKIPTCHRTLPESIMDSNNFELACDYADSVARKLYRSEAKEIDRLQKDILSIVANETPYDVFICYKETDDFGNRTEDSVISQDIYDALTAKGMKVFFARVTLEDKLGQQYEPYIYAALHSAKVMLAIGTTYEYYDAVWVKNEWSRYLDMASKDKSKSLIPCYKNMDVYDIPKEFRNLQAQDMNKLGWQQDLARGVEKLCGKNKPAVVHIQSSATKPASNEILNQLKRGNLALEDGQWLQAKQYFDNALNLDAECAEAYLGIAFAEEGYISKEDYKKRTEIISDTGNYAKARRFANDELNSWFAMVDMEVERKRKEVEQRRKEKISHLEQVRKSISWAAGRLVTLYLEIDLVALKVDGSVAVCIEESIDQNTQSMLRTVCNWKNIVAIARSVWNTVGLKADGTVVAVGRNDYGQCNVSDWKNIIAITCTGFSTIGLKADGTVVAVGENEYGQCNVSGWKDIIAVAYGGDHTIGLKADGTVVAVGNNKYGQCNVSDWKNIVAIENGGSCTLGLKADGTVLAVGNNEYGECNVSGWKDIIAISNKYLHTVGLKADGTVLAVGNNEYGECNVNGWTNIVAVACGDFHTVGLKADGTVVAVGENEYGQCNVNDWKNIVAVACNICHTVGLKDDGTVIWTTNDSTGVHYFSNWKLFNNINTLEKEQTEQRDLMLKRIEKKQRMQKQKEDLEDQLSRLSLFQIKQKRYLQNRIAEIEAEISLL